MQAERSLVNPTREVTVEVEVVGHQGDGERTATAGHDILPVSHVPVGIDPRVDGNLVIGQPVGVAASGMGAGKGNRAIELK